MFSLNDGIRRERSHVLRRQITVSAWVSAAAKRHAATDYNRTQHVMPTSPSRHLSHLLESLSMLCDVGMKQRGKPLVTVTFSNSNFK